MLAGCFYARMRRKFGFFWNKFAGGASLFYNSSNKGILRSVNQDTHIINLEMKISYLEDFVQQLQEVVLEQGAALERVMAENRHIKTKLADMAGQLEGDIPNRRPPHY